MNISTTTIKKILDYWNNSLDVIEAITVDALGEFEKIVPEVNYTYKPNRFNLIEQKSQGLVIKSLA